MVLTGEIFELGPTETRGKFTFRQVVLLVRGEHDQYIKIQFSGRNLEHVDRLVPGCTAEVGFVLRGARRENRNGPGWVYFTNLTGISARVVQQGAPGQYYPQAPYNYNPYQAPPQQQQQYPQAPQQQQYPQAPQQQQYQQAPPPQQYQQAPQQQYPQAPQQQYQQAPQQQQYQQAPQQRQHQQAPQQQQYQQAPQQQYQQAPPQQVQQRQDPYAAAEPFGAPNFQQEEPLPF